MRPTAGSLTISGIPPSWLHTTGVPLANDSTIASPKASCCAGMTVTVGVAVAGGDVAGVAGAQHVGRPDRPPGGVAEALERPAVIARPRQHQP